MASVLQILEHNYNQALIYAERGRSRALLDVLQSEKPDFSKIMTAEEQAQEKKWNQQLRSLNTELVKTREKAPHDPKEIERTLCPIAKSETRV